MTNLLTIYFGSIIIFLAGVISGLTGFGFALFAVPVLMLMLPAKLVVPIILLLSNVPRVILLFETRKSIELKKFWTLIVAGGISTWLGASLLLNLDTKIITIFISVITILSSSALIVGFRYPIKSERYAYIPVGIISGLLHGSTGMGGPPVVLFLSNQRVPKHIFRANLTLFFAVLSISAVIAQVLGGLMTKDVLTLTASFLPTLPLGTMFGIKLAHRFKEEAFRKITLLIILATGLSVFVPQISMNFILLSLGLFFFSGTIFLFVTKLYKYYNLARRVSSI